MHQLFNGPSGLATAVSADILSLKEYVVAALPGSKGNEAGPADTSRHPSLEPMLSLAAEEPLLSFKFLQNQVSIGSTPTADAQPQGPPCEVDASCDRATTEKLHTDQHVLKICKLPQH